MHTFNYLSTIRWINFPLCRRVSCLFQKQWYSYINQERLHANAASRGFQPNRCSLNLQRNVTNSWQQQNPWLNYKKYFWMNSGLIKVQFLLCYFTFTGKMKLIKLLHRYLSSFSWSFSDNSYSAELFSDAYLELSRTSTMGAFLANIVNVNYFCEKALSLNVRVTSKHASTPW